MEEETRPFLGDLEKHERSSTTAPTRRFKSHAWSLVHICLIVLYTTTYFMFWPKDWQVSGTSLIPINTIDVAFTPNPYDDFEQSPFSGPPSAAVDAAWHHILMRTTIRVTPEELHESNQTSIVLPEGGYMAWLGVFHELHCIKMVRQWVYREHYHPNLNDDDVEEWSVHADHCLDILRSAAMCHGDTTLTTFGWANKTKPMLNTRPIKHQCVDWHRLMASINARVVGSEEMSRMVNPNL